MAQPKFTISLLGFDERSTEFLSLETRKTMSIISPISKNDTQVVVVDIDEPNGTAIWDEFRKQWPHMPAVVAASEEPDINDASFAEKPFTVETLIDCITEAIILSPPAEEITDEAAPELEALELEPVLEDFTDSTADAVITEIETGEATTLERSPDHLDDFILQPFDPDTANVAPEEATSSEADEPPPELDALELEFDSGSSSDVAAEVEVVDETVVSEATHETNDTAEAAPLSEKEMPALSEIASSLATRTPSSSAIFTRKLDTTNPDDNFFDPDEHMIGLVLKGIAMGEKTGAIIRLRCLLERTIYIDARNKLVKSNLKDIHMRQISIAPLGKGEYGLDTELEMMDSKSFEELSGNEGAVFPLETFVWELAILTSKGRAPVGTPLDKPIYLMQWPNFTRLMNIPNDMKVAAYWVCLPSSLYDLSDNLNVPMNDILLLYSAASLTGLAGIARRKSDHLLRPSKPEIHVNRSLFGSIIDRLSKR